MYYQGQSWAYKQVHFTVPSGTQRLLARMAFQGVGGSDIVRLTLLDPSGTFVANSRPQGGAATANYANVDVRNPGAGTWTAVLYSVAGTTGYHAAPIAMRFDAQRAVPVGSISPATFTLAPGASRSVKATFTLPASSGDTDYALTFASSDGHQTAVSAVLQTLIDTAHGGAYSGEITGGNARAVSPAQTFSYGFVVPSAGKKDLDVSLSLADDPDVIVDAVLIDPNGELADVGSNITFNSSGQLFQGLDVQLFDAHPLKGTWHLVVVVQNPVSGAEISQQFRGHITFDRLGATRGNLPNSASRVLKAGQPFTTTVTVHNTGVQALAVGADPRLEKVRLLQPVPIQGSTTFPLPADPSDPPVYITPPDTSSLTVAASTSIPTQVEVQGSAAGFDVFGDLQAAQGGSTVSVASIEEHGKGTISNGIWFTAIDEIGPFSDSGEAPGTATITASMRTNLFDPAVTTSTDDPFRISVDPSSDGFGTPVLVPPGGTAAIQVTITPQGHKGSVVSGHLNLVTPPALPVSAGTGLPFYSTGAAIITLPYTYTIG